jgi:oxygen-independent coproporphyrinogen-3 oxidase
MAGIYLHIPFCQKKCFYCDFYSVELRSYGQPIQARDETDLYLDALKQEIDLYSQSHGLDTFETVYFGGGTPSLLPASRVDEILQYLRSKFKISGTAEVTLETNPGTVDRDKLELLRTAGINRLSIGVQSFYDDELRFLGRIHSAKEGIECVEAARSVGFDNISIDLIFGLPSQTIDHWQKSLERAVNLQPPHISAYSLILEEGTPLYLMMKTGKVTPLSDETDAAMYERVIDFLTEKGFVHYEVSNFALPGFRSKHNSNYWNHSCYLGFGPSAHSFWFGRRWWNEKNLRAYCDALLGGESAVAGSESLSEKKLASEYIFLRLRADGINLRELKNEFNIDLIERYGKEIDYLVTGGLVEHVGDVVRMTKRGFLVCDEVIQIFV